MKSLFPDVNQNVQNHAVDLFIIILESRYNIGYNNLVLICAFIFRFGDNMKLLNLLLWVTQFGLSILFPMCFFLLLANWLQTRFGLGMWIVVVCAVLGLLITISTVRSCMRSLRKAADEAASQEKPPIAFNDHS